MLQRSIIRPSTGTASAEQIPPNDNANEAVPRCHPISAMIGFRKTPKVNPNTGPLHTTRPPTAPTTTHHGLVKLSRMVIPPLSSRRPDCDSAALRRAVGVVDGDGPFSVRLSHSAACSLFPQHRDQTLHLSAIVLDDGREFGALGDRHADAVD